VAASSSRRPHDPHLSCPPDRWRNQKQTRQRQSQQGAKTFEAHMDMDTRTSANVPRYLLRSAAINSMPSARRSGTRRAIVAIKFCRRSRVSREGTLSARSRRSR
jgi:hypothetical protein